MRHLPAGKMCGKAVCHLLHRDPLAVAERPFLTYSLPSGQQKLTLIMVLQIKVELLFVSLVNHFFSIFTHRAYPAPLHHVSHFSGIVSAFFALRLSLLAVLEGNV